MNCVVACGRPRKKAPPDNFVFLAAADRSAFRSRLYDECRSKIKLSPDRWKGSRHAKRIGSPMVAHRAMAFAAKEAKRFDALPESNYADRVIAACYQRIRSLELAAGSGRKRESTSHGMQAGTLSDIADQAFALGWRSKDLTHLQQAQLLDILLTISDLMDRCPSVVVHL